MKVVAALLAIVVGLVPLPDARAETITTVTIDAAAVVRVLPTQQSCTGITYPTCTSHYTGVGVGGDGRAWTIDLVRHDYRPCNKGPYGTWTLTASDLSGDSLHGRFLTFLYREDLNPNPGEIKANVTGGTGAYAGATEEYKRQHFKTPGIASSTGCTGSVDVSEVYSGSLTFTVTLPGS